jgi:hypothetical protein
VVAQPSVTGVTTAPAAASPAAAKPGPTVTVKKSGPAYLASRVLHRLGSLQFAVVGLTLFGIVLALGTVVESWYSGKLAQELVYRSWWFALLIGFLGVNIFCAAAKKWPWKKYQTGFIITHVGLLMLVAGGILNALGGTDALMPVIDTDDAQIQHEAGDASRVSKVMLDKDQSDFVVELPGRDKDKPATIVYDPGAMPWGSSQYA